MSLLNKLHVGNNIDVLKTLPDNFVDSIITDPPYGLTSITKRFGSKDAAPAKYGKDGAFQRASKGFMGKEWDGSGIEHNVELWGECLRVAKPGATLMAFGGTRTWHRIAVAIENAGWEIRDTIAWIYLSGFPKSYDISKGIDKKLGKERGKKKYKARPDTSGTMSGSMDTRPWIEESRKKGYHEVDDDNPVSEEAQLWDGWKTALKPSFEPIIVAQKPLDGTNVENALKWGVAGLNIDGGRIEYISEDDKNVGGRNKPTTSTKSMYGGDVYFDSKTKAKHSKANDLGRYPANTILGCYCEDENNHDDWCPVNVLDTQSGIKKGSGKTYDYTGKKTYNVQGFIPTNTPGSPSNRGDSGGASRIFYCAKASKKERNAGLKNLPKKQKVFNGKSSESSKEVKDVEERFTTKPQQNIHPTVKPLELMEYLCTLTKPPTGGIVLDPFTGSGTTLIAAYNTGRDFIGIELLEEYAEIANARLEHAMKQERLF